MSKFKKYHKITNAHHIKTIDLIKMSFDPTLQWVVEEKIHGANFQFILYKEDGKTKIEVAKRSGITDENFFNCYIVIEKYKDDIISLGNELNEFPINIYGELFGGAYPHDDVPEKGIKAIQKGVYYTPDVEFYAFDIRLPDKNFLPVEQRNILFEKYNIPYAKTLFQGTLDECLQYPNAYESTIHTYFDLPPIKDNICEGNVIKPATALYFKNGERAILKNKNSKFGEKKERKDKKQPISISPELESLISECQLYITKNRLDNVISKFGTITQKDFGKLQGLLSKDVLEDFRLENEEYLALEPANRNYFNKKVNILSAQLIREHWINLYE